MKRLLLTFFGTLLFSTFYNAGAQCTITNFKADVTSVQPNPNGPGCELTLTVTFTGNFNNGSSYAVIHLWEKAPIDRYPDPPIQYAGASGGAKPAPTAAQLVNSIANIVIASPGKTPLLSQTYPVPGQGSVPVVYNGVQLTKPDATTFKLTGIKVIISSCETSSGIKGDVWGGQANDGQNSQCGSPGSINYQFTNPIVFGTINCNKPRQFSVTIDNSKSTLPITANYKVYWDDGDGIFEPTTAISNPINTTKDVEVDATPSAVSIAAGATYVSPLTDYTPYSNNNPQASNMLFIQGTTTSTLGTITYNGVEVDNGCGPLPVKFASFTAARNKANKQQVEVSWTTAQEQNNKGFYLQRQTGNEWKDVAFVFSAAEGGNSSEALTYRFKDANTHPGVSQYRLLQVDLDGKATYSNIVSLMGETPKSSVVIYPNPAVGGNVNLVFADAEAAKQVLVSDLSGRVVQQYRNITTASHAISGLKTGFYTIKVTNTKTGETVVEKIIVP